MLAHKFNDLEALRIAVEIERTGQKFYRSMLRLATNDQSREVLTRLAEQEENHAGRFDELYQRELARQEDDGDAVVYDEETNAYLSAIAGEVVFPGGVMASVLKSHTESLADVLVTAIYSEKDSILFYMEMLERVSDPEWKRTFQSIIEEERSHLTELQDMLDALAGIKL